MDYNSCRGRKNLCCEIEADILQCNGEIATCDCLILDKPKSKIHVMYAGKFFSQDCTHFKVLGGSCGEFEFLLKKKFARYSLKWNMLIYFTQINEFYLQRPYYKHPQIRYRVIIHLFTVQWKFWKICCIRDLAMNLLVRSTKHVLQWKKMYPFYFFTVATFPEKDLSGK